LTPAQLASLRVRDEHRHKHRFRSQVDVIIDETYAPDPTAYHLTALLQTYNLTVAEVAQYKWLGSNPKVQILQAR